MLLWLPWKLANLIINNVWFLVLFCVLLNQFLKGDLPYAKVVDEQCVSMFRHFLFVYKSVSNKYHLPPLHSSPFNSILYCFLPLFQLFPLFLLSLIKRRKIVSLQCYKTHFNCFVSCYYLLFLMTWIKVCDMNPLVDS